MKRENSEDEKEIGKIAKGLSNPLENINPYDYLILFEQVPEKLNIQHTGGDEFDSQNFLFFLISFQHLIKG